MNKYEAFKQAIRQWKSLLMALKTILKENKVMEMTIIYIVLIILLLGIFWHIFCHLMIIFHQGTTDLYVKKALEDPYKYVRDEEMCYFIRNMVYLLFVCLLLLDACSGNIHFEKKAKQIEISNVKDK